MNKLTAGVDAGRLCLAAIALLEQVASLGVWDPMRVPVPYWLYMHDDEEGER